MRRALVPTFLLLLGSIVLGATVFAEPLARAAGLASVFVGNDPTHAVPVREQNLDANGNIKVHEQGVAAVTGTFAISGSANTVSLDNTDHSLLDSANTHLANIETQTAKLKFDGSGNLKTAPPAPVSNGCGQPVDISAGDSLTVTCGPTNASLIVVGGFDDSARIRFRHNGFNELVLAGGGDDGSDQYQLPLTQPIPVDDVNMTCDNFIEDCKFFFAVNGSPQ